MATAIRRFSLKVSSTISSATRPRTEHDNIVYTDLPQNDFSQFVNDNEDTSLFPSDPVAADNVYQSTNKVMSPTSNRLGIRCLLYFAHLVF